MHSDLNLHNSMPISSGSFAKTQSIQNDGVRDKPFSVSILDRFRAMLKEKEEEIRVFVGETALPLSVDEVVRIYEISLSSLTFNSKPIITDLTIIAGDQRAHGEGIADAICARIIEVPVDQKLPSLYLLDSIVKNIGKDYITHFSARLSEVFCDTYVHVHPNMQRAMRHLFGTWAAVFPSPVLHKIETQLQFSPSVHGQSSTMNSLGNSESPRPSHGIHVNPKYLDAKRRFGHSTVDTVVTEAVSSTARATSSLDALKKPLPSAAMVPKYASLYRGGPLSSSLEEYTADSSPRRLSVRASPSHGPIDYRPSSVIDKEEERNINLKLSTPYNHTNSVDLRGPRALINAYGIDEREKNLKRKHQQSEVNGVNRKIRMPWQNTEEEEFDWEEDRKRGSEIYSSQPLDNLNMFTTKYEAPLVMDYKGNCSKAQSFVPDSPIVNISHVNAVRASVNKVAGLLPNVASPGDFTRESLILPSQRSFSYFNAKGSSFADNRSFLTSGEQKPQIIGNLPNGKLGDTSTSYNPPEIRSSNLPSSHQFPSVSAPPMQMHVRGQFGMNNSANNIVDQRQNEAFHSEQHLDSSRSNLPHIPSHRHPGTVPLHLQYPVQASQVQPNPLMPHEIRPNVLLPSLASAPSHQVMPPPYGYGPHVGTSLSNLVSNWPNINAPNISFNNIHGPGPAFPPLIRGPIPSSNPSLNIGQNSSLVTANPQPGGALSGLFSSLVAQGLISLNKQDSIGVEFDPDSLKVRHESAITALYTDLPRQCTTCGLRFKCQEEHSQHMDWHVNKNRNLRNRKTKPSPKWFVSVNMWLSGAEAVGAESVPGFLPSESIVEKEDEEMAVPADENQSTCALCGEPFDDYYSDETEEWMYKGAVYMSAPAGSTVGIDKSRLGPIVHVKCRTDSRGASPIDFTKDERESTEVGRQTKRLRS